MRVLVVSPHMDDEVLGVGGTIARHVSTGDEVYVCFIAHRVYSHVLDEATNARESECAQKAKDVLGYTDAEFLNLEDERLDRELQRIIIPLEECVSRVKPQWVYVNHGGDNNQDHRAVFRASMVVLRSYANPHIRRVSCYETPSSTDQAPPIPESTFMPNCYVNIEPYLETKVRALECYGTELRDFPHPRSVEHIRALAMRRGAEIGFNAAEAFASMREKIL